MYNLLIGLSHQDSLSSDRIFEYTEKSIKDYFAADTINKLKSFPALIMPEMQDYSREQLAHVGQITDAAFVGNTLRFTFTPNAKLKPVPTEIIEDFQSDLEIDDWEFNRTHWAVKSTDLHKVILEQSLMVDETDGDDRVLMFPEGTRENDLVAVMMPFKDDFDDAYTVIREAVQAAGMRCARVDTIWEESRIIDDITSLIWRSRVVVADLSTQNSNVFYETGIAHAIHRNTILLTQSSDDVPFDLKSLRYIQYSAQGLGLNKMKERLEERLKNIAGKFD